MEYHPALNKEGNPAIPAICDSMYDSGGHHSN